MLSLSDLGLPLNMAVFALSAIIVWFAGTRLTTYADTISNATGIGQAVLGIVLLAGVTSLPEIGVTAAASLAGDAKLAANNLFGSIALQVALLAAVDAAIGRQALTSVIPDPIIILQGALNVTLLATIAGAIIVGDRSVFGIGLWAWGSLAAYVASVWMLSRTKGRRPWLAARSDRIERALDSEQEEKAKRAKTEHRGLRGIVIKTVLVAIVILSAGALLASSGEAIAQQTGLGSSFIGFVLLAFSTSLPELSTALAAARHGLFVMAISDILGTNLINVGLLFVIDLLGSGDPVISQLGAFSAFGAMLGVVLTSLFLIGLAERRDRTLLRMGYDSILVILAYCGGVVLLYTLRDAA